jgi:curved DNA-binding protein CbpA
MCDSCAALRLPMKATRERHSKMSHDADYYEVLQISPNAEPETVQRIFRIFAQRFHPDNRETGDSARFRAVTEAYNILNDPEQRAQFDVVREQRQRDRWRFIEEGEKNENDFDMEAQARLTVLEVLYTHRRLEPTSPGVFFLDLELLTGRPREHLGFTIWYVTQKGWVARGDNSRLLITADGVDFLEKNYQATLQRRRLTDGSSAQDRSARVA